MHRLRFLLPLAAAVAFPLSAADSTVTPPAAVSRAVRMFSGDAIAAHDKFLASDLLEGRGPGTRGDQLAMEYIAAQFEALGLKPDGDNGTYYQKVPLLGVTTDSDKTTFTFTKNGATPIGPLKYLDKIVGADESQSKNVTNTNALDSELVFVGHGVVAPEYKWDDYKGLDTKGKTLVMLVDDPPANASEPDLFKGKARTYYGRWTYKYEIGGAKGADAVLLVHTNEAAGYPWSVVRNSWGAEHSYLKRGPNDPALKFAGWVTYDVAKQLFAAAGQDLDGLTKAAASRDFKPVVLGGYHLGGTINSKSRSFDSANVVAKLEGSDPVLSKEAILYSAHHDHLGMDATIQGDNIYNGAIDNASGCALLIEMARVWANTTPKPKRSIIFNSVAAEEQGLIGSEYYGKHPSIPAGRIALNLNFDAIPELGRVRDVNMNGIERTTFFPTAQRVTKAMGITIVPDPEPEQGHYYRSDHFSLGKVGVPAVSVDPGQDVIGKPAGWGKEQSTDYREHRYHQPSDEFNPNWDWSEAVEMGQLGFWLGWEAANAVEMPNWNPGDEFRGIRDASLKAARQ
ncbi:MAG TPA: M28 family peptidase [Thermoanaerobaculia bacterium]|nr:M28 family peptidase [Thermoanaerobaculia bacterium]